jgi:hypothetical protein
VKKTLTLADAVLIACISIAVVGSYLWAGPWSQKGKTVLVEVDGRPRYRLYLEESRRVQVAGARGMLVVETSGGRVRVAEADCPNHLCVRAGWQRRAGDVIVCVPNKTVVRILADEAREVRAITG